MELDQVIRFFRNVYVCTFTVGFFYAFNSLQPISLFFTLFIQIILLSLPLLAAGRQRPRRILNYDVNYFIYYLLVLYIYCMYLFAILHYNNIKNLILIRHVRKM